jgi:hypothetical protein
VGEGKSDYFEIMGPTARAYVATYVIQRNDGVQSLDAGCAAMAGAGLTFPVIAKPDVGWCGFGVRLLSGPNDLRTYLAAFPRGQQIILQRYLPQEGEAGLYYVRTPGAASGHVTGMLLRYFPRVTGDGVRTLSELLASDPRLNRLGRDGKSDRFANRTYIPAAGETVRLATIGSTRVGGLYKDASSSITPSLSAAIDAIARDMPDFHVGRFDVRYDSFADLCAGKNFKIMEVNGAGSEAVHAWDPDYSLARAFAIVFAKQRRLFELGHQMRQRGHKPVGPIRLARLFFSQRRLIGQYPPSN